MGLVAVSRYYDPDEAYVARSYLEANGLTVLVQNDHHQCAAPHLRMAIGGFALLTPAAEAAEAGALLKSANEGEAAFPDDPSFRRSCRTCGWDRLSRRGGFWARACAVGVCLYCNAVPLLPRIDFMICPACGTVNRTDPHPEEPDGFMAETGA